MNQAAALTAAIDAMADGVLLGDVKGLHRANEAALKLLGLGSVQELQIEPAELVARLRLRAQREGPLLAADELGFLSPSQDRSLVRELWATRVADGVDVFMRCAAAPIHADGQVVGSVLVLSDLSQRVQLLRQGDDLSRTQGLLRESDAALHVMVHGIRDYAIFTLDRSGLVVGWYRGAELMMGYTAEEAVGLHYSRLFTPEDRVRGLADTLMAAAQRMGEYTGEGLRLRKDGSRFEAAVVLTALRDDKGELRGFIKLTQDIGARRRVERERATMLREAQTARSEAERVSRSKGEFLATVSHELRTPLSAMLGWAQVLERGVFDAETVKQGLSAISRNARVQVQLIEDLLDMNRIELGQLRLDLQRLEIGSVLAAAIDTALPAAQAKHISLHTAFGSDGASLMADSVRLQQVVGKLLGNAIKFTPEGGHVSVGLSCTEGWAQIVVADSGQGIEPQFQSLLFQRFQQQDGTDTRRHGGLGIGLAIVRHLVELHGGSVQAHSAGVGKGATFTVRLPGLTEAGADSVQPAEPVEDATAPARLDGVSVLLVDDAADLREVTAHLLEDAGARVVVASGAIEALELLEREQPDLLLSDIGMPDIDGYELMRRVRQLPAHRGGAIPAAAFTAYARQDDVRDALAAGYQLHLPKPVSALTLVAAVASLVPRGRPPGRVACPSG